MISTVPSVDPPSKIITSIFGYFWSTIDWRVLPINSVLFNEGTTMEILGNFDVLPI